MTDDWQENSNLQLPRSKRGYNKSRPKYLSYGLEGLEMCIYLIFYSYEYLHVISKYHSFGGTAMGAK